MAVFGFSDQSVVTSLRHVTSLRCNVLQCVWAHQIASVDLLPVCGVCPLHCKGSWSMYRVHDLTEVVDV